MKQLLEQYIDKEGYIITEDGLQVNVMVKDVKVSYGNTRFLVSPISGAGEVWKEQVILK